VRVAVNVDAVYATVAAMGVLLPCGTRVKVVVLIVVLFMATENVAETLVVSGAPVAPTAGLTEVMVGPEVPPPVKFAV
jgi:hypothetical protein